MYTDLSYEEGPDHVGVITLCRPAARNALTLRTYDELEDAVRRSQARCLVITGQDPAFCSGDDVKQVLAAPKAPAAGTLGSNPRLWHTTDALLHSDIPIVAAVNGAAVGWGMELAMTADIRVASERAKFGEVFVLLGIMCDAPGLGRLVQAVGREKAAELLFTGDIIAADEAQRIGLVSRVVPHGELMDVALGIARRIAANPPLAVQLPLKQVNLGF